MNEKQDNVYTVKRWRKRLIFRSWHRGTKEMDLLLGHFADLYIQTFTEAQLQEYEDVLSLNDPDLYKMYLGQRVPEEGEQSDILQLFLSFVLKPT